MAQLVARLVRNEKVGGSNPPSSTTGRHPIRVSVFCMPGRVGVVPGCSVCPWAAARPRAVRAASFARRVGSKPGQAPPPPTGTAAWPCGPSGALRRPPHQWRLVADVLLGASARSPARPRHCPPAPRPGPPAPSTPVGPVVLMRIHIIAEPTPNFACNSPTTLSNPEIRSLELQRFLTLLKLHLIELHATFLRQAPPPPTGTAAWPCGPSGALRRPPHQWRLVADVLLGASARSPARPRHRPRAPRPTTHVKPSTPLLACALSSVKPTTPLQARYTCFRRNFGAQRRHGFHGSVLRLPQWC